MRLRTPSTCLHGRIDHNHPRKRRAGSRLAQTLWARFSLLKEDRLLTFGEVRCSGDRVHTHIRTQADSPVDSTPTFQASSVLHRQCVPLWTNESPFGYKNECPILRLRPEWYVLKCKSDSRGQRRERARRMCRTKHRTKKKTQLVLVQNNGSSNKRRFKRVSSRAGRRPGLVARPQAARPWTRPSRSRWRIGRGCRTA